MNKFLVFLDTVHRLCEAKKIRALSRDWIPQNQVEELLFVIRADLADQVPVLQGDTLDEDAFVSMCAASTGIERDLILTEYRDWSPAQREALMYLVGTQAKRSLFEWVDYLFPVFEFDVSHQPHLKTSSTARVSTARQLLLSMLYFRQVWMLLGASRTPRTLHQAAVCTQDLLQDQQRVPISGDKIREFVEHWKPHEKAVKQGTNWKRWVAVGVTAAAIIGLAVWMYSQRQDQTTGVKEWISASYTSTQEWIGATYASAQDKVTGHWNAMTKTVGDWTQSVKQRGRSWWTNLWKEQSRKGPLAPPADRRAFLVDDLSNEVFLNKSLSPFYIQPWNGTLNDHCLMWDDSSFFDTLNKEHALSIEMALKRAACSPAVRKHEFGGFFKPHPIPKFANVVVYADDPKSLESCLQKLRTFPVQRIRKSQLDDPKWQPIPTLRPCVYYIDEDFKSWSEENWKTLYDRVAKLHIAYPFPSRLSHMTDQPICMFLSIRENNSLTQAVRKDKKYNFNTIPCEISLFWTNFPFEVDHLKLKLMREQLIFGGSVPQLQKEGIAFHHERDIIPAIL
jgi:hypothetical protein